MALHFLAVIFIPSPNVSEDHQTKNALAVSEQGAALLIREQVCVGQELDVWSPKIKQTKREK